MSFLAIKRIDELFDFQLNGNYNNWQWGLTKAPSDNVLPVSFSIEGGEDIITFEARKGHIFNDEFILDETITLVSNRIISAIVTHASGYEVTTSRAHGLVAGDLVTQSGFVAPDTGYNGVKTVLSITSTTKYVIAGTFTNNVTGAVLKKSVTIRRDEDFYNIRANELLPTLLANGIYYFYFYDGNKERKSEIFCINGEILTFIIALADQDSVYLVDENGKLLVTFE